MKKEMANEPNHSMLLSFYVGNAIKYSIAGALIIERLRLVEHQGGDNIYRASGKKYLIASLSDFAEMYPFLSTAQIKVALNELVNDGAVERRIFADSSFAQTAIYALTEKGMEV